MVIWFVGRFQLLATGGLAVVCLRLFNPFTAPTCNISGLKDVGTRLPTAYVSVLQHLLSMLCVSMKIFSHASVKKKTETIKGFKFYTFIGRF